MLDAISLLAQSSLSDGYESGYYYSSSSDVNGAAAAGTLAFMAVFWLFYLAVLVLMILSMWKLFVKAGKPGWAAIVPIYNQIVLLEIVNKPTWWIVLYFVPFANLVVAVLVSIELARVFGKSDGFAALLILLPVVGYPMLAFDKNTHFVGAQGMPVAAPTAAAPQTVIEQATDDTSTPA